MTKIKILSTLVLILICCSYNYKKTDHENSKPNGIWKQIGYGNIIEVKDSTIKVYDIAKQNCDLSYEEEILDFGKIKSWTKDTLTIQHGIDNWLFTRLDELPELCNTPVKELKNDPKHNFNVFWNTFNEHYSSFEIKEIDWEKEYETYNSKITSNTTELELYMIFQEMIALLDDGHVKMEVPESIEEQYNNKVKQKKEKYSKLDEFELHEEIAKLYVDSLRNYNAGMIRYGLVNKNVGYIQINSMLMLADYNLQRDLNLMNFFNQYWEVAEKSKDEIQRQEEVDGIHKILNSIIKEFKDARSYILDLRFNGGGKDGVALAILNHFSNTEKVAFIKRARLGSRFTKDQEIHVFPNNQNFTGNVYLLTSGRTASASEILVLASLQNPNFTRIGSTTEGIFSSTLDKKLPNGWEYELSNEVYQDLKGNNYENIGISPDFPLEYSKDKDIFFDQLFDDLKNKKDKAIELAIKLENKKTK